MRRSAIPHRSPSRPLTIHVRGARWSLDFSRYWEPDIWGFTCFVLFVVAAVNSMEILTLDVSGAYLLGRRSAEDDTVYLRMPAGMEHIAAAMKARGMRIDPRILYTAPDGSPMVWECEGNLR